MIPVKFPSLNAQFPLKLPSKIVLVPRSKVPLLNVAVPSLKVVAVKVPATWSREEGVVVPMPTKPPVS